MHVEIPVYKEIVFVPKSHSLCRPTICHSSFEIWDRNVKRQKSYDRLNIGIMGITVNIIFPHQSPYIVLSVLKGPFLRLGLSYKKRGKTILKTIQCGL